MTADAGKPEPGPDAGIDDVQADIEATRSQLGDTVGALSAKLDVKQQARQKVADVTTDDAGAVRPVVPVAALAVIAAIVGFIIWKRRR